MVRVIAGDARGRKLKTIEKETTKPTLDRVKEAMFSMLTPYVPGARVLDLFSGNGSLGIEALSRGAAYCLFNDYSNECAKIIKENVANVGYAEKSEVASLEFGELIARESKKGTTFDLLLLDPPYNKGLISEALRLISEKFGENAIIAMCEHSADEQLAENIGKFVKTKEKRYGTVALTIYVKDEKNE